MASQDPEPSQRLNVASIDDATIEAVSSEPDPTTKNEIQYWEREGTRAKVVGAFQNIGERKKFARWIYYLVAVWLALMLSILVVQGFKVTNFQLADAVLIALVTTTTTGVVGLLYVVVKYLFQSNEP
jgi:hypothetical protein